MEISELLRSSPESLKILYVTVINLTALILIYRKIFDTKHSIWCFVSFMCVRTIFVKILLLDVVAPYIYKNSIMLAGAVFINVIFFVGTILLFPYTFKGSFSKLMLYEIFLEIYVSILGSINIVVVNKMAGRADLMEVRIPLEWIDVLLFIFSLSETVIFLKAGKRIIRWLKKYQLKHERFWLAFVMIHLFAACILSPLEHFGSSLRLLAVNAGLWIGVSALFLVIIGIYTWNAYKQQVVRNHRFLKKQQMLMLTHVKAVQMQIHRMEEASVQLNEEIKKLSANEEIKLSDERISKYLFQLKVMYFGVQAGMYCNDWIIDAALFYLTEQFEQSSTECEFDFREYDRGNIPEEEIAGLLLSILYFKHTRVVSIKSKAIADELFFRITGLDERMFIIRKKIRYWIKKYNGMVWQDKKSKDHTVLIKLTRV